MSRRQLLKQPTLVRDASLRPLPTFIEGTRVARLLTRRTALATAFLDTLINARPVAIEDPEDRYL